MFLSPTRLTGGIAMVELWSYIYMKFLEGDMLNITHFMAVCIFILIVSADCLRDQTQRKSDEV